MPYIKKEERAGFDNAINSLLEELEGKPRDEVDGCLNYIITRLIKGVYKNAKYFNYNSAIGVLECAKQEFYRRVVADYEDEKRKENGEV